MKRTLLHCDCNGFYASVEMLMNPMLKNVPMAVAGDPDNRHGIILAKNELAKAKGVVTAETIAQAKKKCPNLHLVPPHHPLYQDFSEKINHIYLDYTDLVEPFGIDESWLDVTGVTHLFGDGAAMATILRERIKKEMGLSISVGISFNKIFAKLGSDYKKPDAQTLITPDNFKDVLYPLPVSAMLYVGKQVATKLESLSIRTIGDLATCDKTILMQHLGKTGSMLYDYANGLDNEPVRSFYDQPPVKSIGNGMTFKRNLLGLDDIRMGVLTLSDQIGFRMRKAGVCCETVSVVIKDPNFKSISRQVTLKQPTDVSKVIEITAIDLITSNWNLNKPIRMLTITGMNLVPITQVVHQLSFLDEDNITIDKDRFAKLEQAMDQIRNHYGNDAIMRAGTLINDIGIRSNKKER